MTTLKSLTGDSLQSSEFWALPPTLTLLVEGGLTDAECYAVAAVYASFVMGRTWLKVRGVAEVAETARRAAPLLLVGLVLSLLPSCGSLVPWLDRPAQPAPQGPPPPVVVEGVGTVTLEPEPEPQTNGDVVARDVGALVAAVTGLTALGMLVSKGLGAAIGSRRRNGSAGVPQ